jgi:hypothetical protein
MIGSEDCTDMPALHNPRHEHFAQLVAAGQSPAHAYATAGYEERTAYTCGPRLLKTAAVRDRVTELRQKVAEVSVTRAAVNREFVLRELMDNAMKAKQNQQWSASNRALELIGRDLGMFDGTSVWDGDPDKLTADQIRVLMGKIEQAIIQKRARAALEAQLPAAKQTVDVMCTPGMAKVRTSTESIDTCRSNLSPDSQSIR